MLNIKATSQEKTTGSCRQVEGVLPAASKQLPPLSTVPSAGLHFPLVQAMPAALVLQSASNNKEMLLCGYHR